MIIATQMSKNLFENRRRSLQLLFCAVPTMHVLKLLDLWLQHCVRVVTRSVRNSRNVASIDIDIIRLEVGPRGGRE